MKVETYLKQGRMLDQRINYHLKKLAELQNAACSLPAMDLRKDRVQTSPTGDAPFVSALMRVEELQGQINREIDLLVDLRKQIHEVIQQVDREELRMLLIYKYLEGMSNVELIKTFNVEKTTLYRWLNQALSQITLPEEPIVARTMF